MDLQDMAAQGGFPSFLDMRVVNLFVSAFQAELDHLNNVDMTMESWLRNLSGVWIMEKNRRDSLFRTDYAEVNWTLEIMTRLRPVSAAQESSTGIDYDICVSVRQFKDIYTLLVAVVTDDFGKDPHLVKDL
ncbi:uncharacterized protein EURHEDRAFT_406048 [Aspergillus ruber CBS 135680]|uniref:Uncharacterized protein n=1 Tax=Aspergillus ruber (strain CBS 135680) TaxID=1388766 RepID=A0A017S3G3_ASPRC|nr:uncharacterized protein EURHEDRAFT_406048 [Aspergillus ruber CBS 135680]EYE91386.1 hypothetical protein EURHEDRAFT_406048 [Aspergillus ruber CBS 135680]